LKAKGNNCIQEWMAILFLTSTFFVNFLHSSVEQTKFSRVDDIFAKFDRTNSPGCALAIIMDGKIVYRRCFGMASLDHEITIKPYTVFRIGSMSKQFTAASILILHKMGKLSLDDDIRRYIPEMPEYKWPITIRHLVHHTGGIREYEMLQDLAGELNDQGHHSNDDILELLTRQKGLNFKPGEKCQYANSGYTLLSIIIERVSGMSIGQFTKKNIFDPLNMKNTFILEDNTVIVKNRATGYSVEHNGFKVNETLNESTGDGAVFTTIEDFFLWDQNFYHNRIDCNEFIEDMQKVGKLNDGSDATLGRGQLKYGYASGLVISKYRGLKTIGHGGAFVGFRAGYVQFPDNKFSVIILANLADIKTVDLCYDIADIFLEDYFLEEKPAKPNEESLTEQLEQEPPILSGEKLREYVGEYYGDELMVTYILKEKDGNLFFTHENAVSNEPLKWIAEDTFNYWALQLKFIREKNNTITGFINESNYIKGMFFKKIR